MGSVPLYPALDDAIIAGRQVRHSGARAAIFLAVAAVLLMVGASRVYLGVHYATDVVSGISFGAAWALLLAGIFTFVAHRGSSCVPTSTSARTP
jgi:undecaprenyl-diphosphatase